jgi:hypothetical protein
VVAEGVGAAARKRKIEDLYGRLASLVRDAVGLDVTEDDLWERFEVEFQRVHERASRTGT